MDPVAISNVLEDQFVQTGNLVDKDMRINFTKYSRPGYRHRKWIVYSHSNATTIFHHHEYAKMLVLDLDIGCILYDYPGYGLSLGKPTEYTCEKSLEIVIKYMLESMEIPKENIILMGQSIGTGIVISYAHHHQWTYPIVLLCPYTTIINIVFNPILSSLLYPFDKFTSVYTIKKLDCPIKIFHGTDDQFIPLSHSITLANVMKNKLFDPVWLQGASHNDIAYHILPRDLIEVIGFNTKYTYKNK